MRELFQVCFMAPLDARRVQELLASVKAAGMRIPRFATRCVHLHWKQHGRAPSPVINTFRTAWYRGLSPALAPLLCEGLGAGSVDKSLPLTHLADVDGWTPLMHLACDHQWASPEWLAALISLGADVNAVSTYRHRTALHIAANEGNGALMAPLIAAGAQLEARDVRGRTPLLTACAPDGRSFSSITPIVAVLITSGADAHAVCSDGKGALELLREGVSGADAIALVQAARMRTPSSGRKRRPCRDADAVVAEAGKAAPAKRGRGGA